MGHPVYTIFCHQQLEGDLTLSCFSRLAFLLQTRTSMAATAIVTRSRMAMTAMATATKYSRRRRRIFGSNSDPETTCSVKLDVARAAYGQNRIGYQLQGTRKKYVNLAKQDPGRARQNS